MMKTDLTIQEVAALTGLSGHTLRYYERIGLLDHVNRADSGHRRYSNDDIAWIEFLTRLRATGMPICQMQQFAALRRQGDITVSARRELLEKHWESVQLQLAQLQRHLSVIESKIKYYKGLEANHDTGR